MLYNYSIRTSVHALFLFLILCFAIVERGRAQSNNRGDSVVSDRFSMSTVSSNKPSMEGFVVKLKGDPGLSIIDANGNILSRNFAPTANSDGEVVANSYSNPVINGIFSVVRYQDRSRNITIYRNAKHPTPVPGLSDLWSANIINPNLFPICKRGERIKFVDSNGTVKFVVMPIDGKEPRSVIPIIIDGLIVVEVVNDVKTKDSNHGECIVESTTKHGAINTSGKWTIYPEWDMLEPLGNMKWLGEKEGKRYIVSSDGSATLAENQSATISWDPYAGSANTNIMIEEFINKGIHYANIFNNGKYVTTLENADYIRPNHFNSGLLLVRWNFGCHDREIYSNLVDINKNNAVISKNYDHMDEIPGGNYIAKSSDSSKYKRWYVTAKGVATQLPGQCQYLLDHPLMALFYKNDITNFIVMPTENLPGYICDIRGKKVSDVMIEVYYNRWWEGEPVKSCYWKEHILGHKDY